MLKHQALISKLNFSYWASKNEVYGKYPLNSSVMAMHTIQKKRNILTEFKPSSFLDIVNEINFCIDAAKNNIETIHVEKIAYIFDLIQLWGGRTGRGPYVFRNKDGFTTREKFLTVYGEKYRSVIADGLFRERKFVDTNFSTIPRIGISFATKHLRFWCDYPVHDLRTNLLVFGTTKMQSYSDYFNSLERLANDYNMDLLDIEKALFSFSNNFFPNSTLKLNSNHRYHEDIEIALALSQN